MQINSSTQCGRPKLLVVGHLLDKYLVAVVEAINPALGIAWAALSTIEVADVMVHANGVVPIDGGLVKPGVFRIVLLL